MSTALANRYSRDLSHLRFVEAYARRAGFYALAGRVQEMRKAVQEHWARDVYRFPTPSERPAMSEWERTFRELWDGL